MRYFYDTEFLDNGTTLELVSIGIVAEDGREYYACSTDFHPGDANQWVRTHVLSQLPSPASPLWKPRRLIAEEVAEFLLAHHPTTQADNPQLWAWVGGYDHVVYAQLFGSMADMPARLPRFTHELKQYWEFAGRPWIPTMSQGQHDALEDARHNRDRFVAIAEVCPLDRRNAIQRSS
ncbi:polyadenylate-specific 3'-exoribonuclease AS [Corynebacterium choanae]|uniref:3'-5' exoribonuclease n=1 Tax=Corynebacterium choanae TaxID=1862358 RepID=A0A3G6J7K3_9CORY|nr:polyadenylate-specific 3'-exoribonuclease AS [Corynebacterium choanae]AZA13966.1 3'-5' exoribonuclease.1 [Corynebacterium choanae]